MVGPKWIPCDTPGGRRDVSYVWRVQHNAAVVAWHKRQVGAVATLRPCEDAILSLAHGILTWVERVGPDSAADGFSAEHVLNPLLSAFSSALELDRGRLDGGTLSGWAFDLATRLGWDLDQERFIA